MRNSTDSTYGLVRCCEGGGASVVLLAVVDEYTHECLALEAAGGFTSTRVAAEFEDLFAIRARPEAIRASLVPPPYARAVRSALQASGPPTRHVIENRSWWDGALERFLRRLLDGVTVEETSDLEGLQRALQRWRNDYNHRRRQWRLGRLTPSQFASGRRPERSRLFDTLMAWFL